MNEADRPTPAMIEAGAEILDLDTVRDLADGFANRWDVVERIYLAMHSARSLRPTVP